MDHVKNLTQQVAPQLHHEQLACSQASASSSRNSAEKKTKEVRLHFFAGPRIDLVFTKLYQTAWTSKFSTDAEKQGVIACYTAEVVKIGWERAKGVLDYLSSDKNKQYIDYPPAPHAFLILSKSMPTTPVFFTGLTKKPTVTLKSRIFCAITLKMAGAWSAEKEKKFIDIIELVDYNLEKFKEHISRHGYNYPRRASYLEYECVTSIQTKDCQEGGKFDCDEDF